MSAPGKRLLVVSQRSDRTGAPVQLAVLLDGLGEQLDLHVTMLLGSSGVLAPVLADRAHEVKREPGLLRALGALARRAPPRIGRLLERAWAGALRRHVGRHDLVYVNSLSSRRLAMPFVQWPMLLHVHEIGTFAEASGEQGRELCTLAARIAVPSRIAEDWVVRAGVEPDRVTRLPGALADTWFEAPDPAAVERLAGRLALPPSALVVSSIGWIGEMKGSDRFIEVAACLAASDGDRDIRMIWVGGDTTSGAGGRFVEEIERRDLADTVILAPNIEDLRPVYALSTAVLVASREESLSLVALEAAAQRCPVVAFPGAGGPDELADEGIVMLPDRAEPDAVAALLTLLHDSADTRSHQAEHAYRAVVSSHRREHGQGALIDSLRAVVRR